MEISFVESLMKFNMRVLTQGEVHECEKYSLEELKNLLFFNKIFINNMNELFEKYHPKNIIEDYVTSMKKYESNIDKILNILCDKYEIDITDKSTFNSRLKGFKYYDQLIGTTFTLNTFNPNRDYEFKSNQIYYLIFDLIHGQISICYIDENRSAYNDIIYDTDEFDSHMLYFRNDRVISDLVSSDNRGIVIAVKPTINSGNIIKIEFMSSYGEYVFDKIYKLLKTVFPYNCIFVNNKYLYLNSIERIINLNNHKIPEHKPEPVLFTKNIFNDIFSRDRLMEYPIYDFKSYLSLLENAVENPSVTKIYITLYRIGEDPSIYNILEKGFINGKKILVNIELRASGENINYFWLKEFKKIGVNVTTFGYPSIKVHCKLTLIEFENGMNIAQIGTGNYHSKTTSQYTDLSLMTSDKSICQSIKQIFEMIENDNADLFKFSEYHDEISQNNDVLITKFGNGYNDMRKHLSYYILQEANKGPDGYIAIKANSLSDSKIIKSLEYASNHGCKIDLIIRGACTWVPNNIGKNVLIKSVVWDKLEHSRIYCFGKVNPTVYIGSLDLVTKKLDERLETLVKIKDPDILVSIIKNLNKYITNNINSWNMMDGGFYFKEE